MVFMTAADLTIREGWLDIFRSIGWWILKFLLGAADIINDVIKYIVTLNFLESTEFGAFFKQYSVLLNILLIFAIIILGILILQSDSPMTQKSKLKNLTGVFGLLLLFSTVYPTLVSMSTGMSVFISEQGGTSISQQVMSTTRIRENGEFRQMTTEEVVNFIASGDVNARENYQGVKDVYIHDLPWLPAFTLGIILIVALSLLGFNAFRIVIDFAYIKLLSIFGLPFAVVNEQFKKQFMLDIFKTLITLPLSLLAINFFITATMYVLAIDIFVNGSLLAVYSNNFWLKSITQTIFYLIAMVSLTVIALDGSARTLGMFGVDTGIKSPLSALASLGVAKQISAGAKSIGRGVKNTLKAPGNIARGAASTAGYIKGAGTGIKDAMANKDTGKEKTPIRLGKNATSRKSKNEEIKPTTRQGKNVQEKSFRSKLAEQHKNKKQEYNNAKNPSNNKSKRSVSEHYRDASYKGYKHVGNGERRTRKASVFLRGGRSGKQGGR